MAISEDTAALVAAQLTVAWATRAGVAKADPANPITGQIAEVYTRFHNAVGEVDISEAIRHRPPPQS